MRTEDQILQEITRLENLDVSPDVDHLTRINALQWVLDSGESAMCEADSNAVLAEVRADLKNLLFFVMDRNDDWDDEISLEIKKLMNKYNENF